MPLRPEVLKGWPPGGWQYYQPETGWPAPSPMVFTFDQQVSNIMAMRKQNPRFKLATDYLSAARDLENYTGARIGYLKKYWDGGDDAQKKTTLTSLHHPLPQVPVGAVADAKADPRALVEWFGAGMAPVARALAEQRASICADCPENSNSPNCPEPRRNSWTDWVTGPVAHAFRLYIGIKHRMKIETSRDDELGRCLACQCELCLKVHSPLHHIKDNMDPKVLTRLRSVKNCWVMTEQ